MNEYKVLEAAQTIRDLIQEAKNATSMREVIQISILLLPINDMIYRFGEDVLKPISEKLQNGEDPFKKEEDNEKLMPNVIVDIGAKA